MAQVADQLDLKGLVLSSTMIDTCGDYAGIARQGSKRFGWNLDVDCGHYYHALYTMGILSKIDLPSQANRSKFQTTVSFMTSVGLYRRLMEDVFLPSTNLGRLSSSTHLYGGRPSSARFHGRIRRGWGE